MAPRTMASLALLALGATLSCASCAPLDSGASSENRPASANSNSYTVRVAAVLREPDGKPLTGLVSALFAIYDQPRDGAPMWQEVQNVQVDARGHFSATVGSTSSSGIPGYIFSAAKSRWLGIQALLPGQMEQPRLRLASTPQGLVAVESILTLPWMRSEPQPSAPPMQAAPPETITDDESWQPVPVDDAGSQEAGSSLTRRKAPRQRSDE